MSFHSPLSGTITAGSDAGTAVSTDQTWSTTLGGTPADKEARGDNATQASITVLSLDDNFDSGVDFSTRLTAVVSGDTIYFEQHGDSTRYHYFVVSGAVTDQTGYFDIPVTSDNGGSALEDGAICTIKIFKDGADSTAIHDNVAGEITAVPAKTVIAAADVFLIEDSASGDAKKRTSAQNMGLATKASTTTSGAASATVLAFPTSTDKGYLVAIRIVGRQTNGANETNVYDREIAVKNNGGTVTIGTFGAIHTDTSLGVGTWSIAAAVDGTSVDFNVTGVAGDDISWKASATVEVI